MKTITLKKLPLVLAAIFIFFAVGAVGCRQEATNQEQATSQKPEFTGFVLVTKDNVDTGGGMLAPTSPVAVQQQHTLEQIAEAREKIDKVVQGVLIPRELARITKENTKPHLNPFDFGNPEKDILKYIVDQLEGHHSLEILKSQATSKYELETLERELFTDPIKKAVDAAREQWDKDMGLWQDPWDAI